MPRSYETQVSIHAPLEEVWSALTEPAQLMRWLSPNATVEPGAGGRIALQWARQQLSTGRIEVWEPGTHLRLIDIAHPLVQDFYLKQADGKTHVQLVHSGFGDDEEWDLKYDRARGDWFSWLYRLQLVLERHRGEQTLNGLEHLVLRDVSRRDALSRFEAVSLPGCEVVYRKPDRLGALLTAHNGAILTVSAHLFEGGTKLSFEYLFFASAIEAAGRVVAAVRAGFRSYGTAPGA